MKLGRKYSQWLFTAVLQEHVLTGERGKIAVYSSSSLESDWSELENFGLELSFFPNWICESKLKHMGNFYSFILFIPSFFVKKNQEKEGQLHEAPPHK